jgi:uracil phosphoribosyltransferase
MEIIDLSKQDSIFNYFISELRDENIQKDPLRFRRNLERIGEVFALEISKRLTYEEKEVVSPLGVANMRLISEKPIVGSILRAGLPMHQGVLNYFDRADNLFVSAYRKYDKSHGSFDIHIEYVSGPDLGGRTLIVTDPMLATGASMVLTIKALLSRKGNPKHIHIVTAIASVEGLEHLKKNLPENVTVWLGALDDELTAQSYIVPGLGDAGDLAFGEKE